MRRSQPGFDLKAELKNPEMRRLMQLPGMRVQDAYRLAHYEDAMRTTAQTVEQGVVERVQQRAARPLENGLRPGAAASVRPDVAAMTRAQREALSAVCCTVHRSNFNLTGERKKHDEFQHPAVCGRADQHHRHHVGGDENLLREAPDRSGRAAPCARPVCGLLPRAPERRQDHRVPQVRQPAQGQHPADRGRYPPTVRR